jgi:uncharacterized protein
MADKISINRVTNANIFVNGNSLLGKADEITLPSVKNKMVEHKALGMVGSLEFPSGVEKLEGKIKWNSFYEDVLAQMANPYATLQIQVRASLESYASAGRINEVPVVAIMTIMPKSLPGGAFKQNDNVEMETDFTANYFKLTVGGKDIVEVDVLANIYKAGGVDVLSNYRTNIGG